MDVQVNFWAVLLAAASSMVIGSMWYSQSAFGKAWVKLAKIKMDRTPRPSEMAWLLSSTFVASLLTAYILAHVTFLSNQFFQNSFLQDALTTGFWLWLGFVLTRFYVHDAFEGRTKWLTTLNVGHEFVTIMTIGLIIGVMGI